MRRSDFHLLHHSRVAQFDQAPVRARLAPAPGFPAIAHVHAPARHDQAERHAKVRIVIGHDAPRSEEHTSELQSLMRISYAVFCLKKKNKKNIQNNSYTTSQ